VASCDTRRLISSSSLPAIGSIEERLALADLAQSYVKDRAVMLGVLAALKRSTF
jgi:hypothetical protein